MMKGVRVVNFSLWVVNIPSGIINIMGSGVKNLFVSDVEDKKNKS